MATYALPALFALFAWWFSTGAILFLDGLPRATWRWSMLGASVVFVAALYGLAASAGDTGVLGAYCGFTCALLAWAWIEIGFVMGFVTGVRKAPSPPGTSRLRQAAHATQAILWHELAILGAGIAVVALTWGAANQVGTWTFVILWAMRTSAKLNLFLGVRNLYVEFLPEHMRFLEGFLTRKPMNLLFPLSVTAGTAVAAALFLAAAGASEAAAVGYVLLGTLLSLAVLEHWFLVLPLPTAALWSWGLANHNHAVPAAPLSPALAVVVTKPGR
jgi:putative photosynthetic complex assembly protein 2